MSSLAVGRSLVTGGVQTTASYSSPKFYYPVLTIIKDGVDVGQQHVATLRETSQSNALRSC